MVFKMIQQRIFAGTAFRPRPKVIADVKSRRLTVITRWSGDLSIESLASKLDDFLNISVDLDVTKISGMDPVAAPEFNEKLNSSLKSANEIVLSEYNSVYLKHLVEVSIFQKVDQQLHWACCSDLTVAARQGNRLMLLSASESAVPEASPLPLNALGVSAEISVSAGTCDLKGVDSLVLVACSFNQQELLKTFEGDFKQLESALIESDYQSPFWLAEIPLRGF
jgi:hypothetical protein